MTTRLLYFLTLALLLTWPAAGTAAPNAAAATVRPAFHESKLKEMDSAIVQAIAEKRLPGGVLWLEREGDVYAKPYGHRALVPAEEPMTADTIFDAASLTKVVATAPAIMLLLERGKLQLDDPVQRHLPEFKGDGKEAITLRHLLTHTSGLRSGIGANPPWTGYARAIELACEEKLRAPPGTAFVYSDINYILLGEVVQRASQKSLDEFVAREIFQPLKMTDTGYLPPAAKRARIAPTTESKTEGVLRGVVHDPTSRRMGGVAGHAGLFTTAADLARYGRMLLGEGALDGVRILKPETVRLMTSVQSPAGVAARRGLGWDIDSSYSRPRGEHFPLGSFGHTGWTGTSIWVDPFSSTFLIFVSNRNHPTEAGSVLALRHTLATLAAEAITSFNFMHVPGALPARVEAAPRARTAAPANVLNGIDVLAKKKFAPLKGLRIGLITNHSGQDRDRNPTIDILNQAPGVQLKALFAPEHGIRGTADTTVSDSVDEQTGIPIYSLYGSTPKRESHHSDADYNLLVIQSRGPKLEHLQELDALVFDIQDIGARFYTYSSTLGAALDSAAKAGKKIFVLDRVNPITGRIFEGPVQTRHRSFIGFHNLPVRHGMTLGELARMFNAELGFNADLTVIACENWKRDLWFDQTGLPWTNPSPSMRSLNAATLYTGACLLESTTVSMGRGTDKPFEQVGAPYIDDQLFAQEMNRAGLPGVQFVPVRFTPVAEYYPGPVRYLKHHNQECGGVYMVLTDRDQCNVVDFGIVMAQVLHRLYPLEFDLDKMARLLGHDETLEAIKAGKSLSEIKQIWAPDLQRFKERRQAFLLYK